MLRSASTSASLHWAQELGRREQRNVFASVIARLEKAYVVRAGPLTPLAMIASMVRTCVSQRSVRAPCLTVSSLPEACLGTC